MITNHGTHPYAENCVLLGYNTARSVHYALYYNPEKGSSQPLRGSLKSPILMHFSSASCHFPLWHRNIPLTALSLSIFSQYELRREVLRGVIT
jgi:hypothetical protein